MASEEEVQVVESCFVMPVADTPRKVLWLSALDLMLANRGYTPLIHLYRRRPFDETTGEDFFNVTKLKTALGKALVGFYPMAGRLRVDADGRLEIDCNSKGMLFLVARSQLTIDDFSDLKPSPRLRRLFVPQMLSAEVCATQVQTILSSFFGLSICPKVAVGMASDTRLPCDLTVDLTAASQLEFRPGTLRRRGEKLELLDHRNVVVDQKALERVRNCHGRKWTKHGRNQVNTRKKIKEEIEEIRRGHARLNKAKDSVSYDRDCSYEWSYDVETDASRPADQLL